MLNKIIKRAHKKSSKWEVDGNLSGYQSSEVVGSHASRTATNSAIPNLDPHIVAPAVVPPISGVIELLPPLRKVEVSEAASIFLQKVQICSVLFDFSDNLKSVRQKEIKRQTLNDLVDILQSGSFKLSHVMQEELITMVSVNIFRCLPPASHENTGIESVDPEDDNPYKDRSWPHLQIVYEILLKYIMSSDTDIKIARRYIDHIFVLKLLDLFDSEDQRERESLKIILHGIYGKFMVHRPLIRKAINDIFYWFIFETERHNAIAELLEILCSIINGFALPMKEEHRLFLIRALIPLHKPKCVSTYHLQLSYCITQFVEKDHRLADPVIRGLLKYWPVTNCQKEVLFIGELEEVLEVTQCAEFQQFMVPLFRQIGRCLNSPQFQVAERAFYLWKNEHIIGLIAQNRYVIFPLIFEALEKNMKGHWSQSVYVMSVNLRKMFREMDAGLFEQCQRQYSENVARAPEMDKQRNLIWNKLEAVAAEVVRDDMVLVI